MAVAVGVSDRWNKTWIFFLQVLKFWEYRFGRKTRIWRQIWKRYKIAWIKYLTYMHSFSSFWRKIKQFGRNSKKLNSAEFMEFAFSKSGWQVTGDTRHLTPDMWHVTPNTWHFFLPSLSFSVRFVIGDIIPTRREIQCLPYAGFVYPPFIILFIVFIHPSFYSVFFYPHPLCSLLPLV